MPRRPRLSLPHVRLHLIQRGNNRQACFYAYEDYRRYLDWLEEYAATTGCRLHAYVLMTNHSHLPPENVVCPQFTLRASVTRPAATSSRPFRDSSLREAVRARFSCNHRSSERRPGPGA
jgi:REP element-mobilizing transposase RayT